jgi:UDP-3-O-[3-hydroxymyristoyl] N-acetylglucosamine deacetylase
LTDLYSKEMQKTLKEPIAVSGVGIFTGQKVSVRICPAPVNTGIVFKRVDIEGSPEIPALLNFVQESLRCTRLGIGKVGIFMVEHLLSALYAYGVDNGYIEVNGPEIPGCDGSAKVFVDLMDKVGLEIQDNPCKFFSLDRPVFWSRDFIHLVALPSSEFRLSYTLHYPQSSLIGSQYYSCFLNKDLYREEIASCRTFSLYEEIAPLIEKGLILGGGLDNALVIRENQVMNPEGARFPDEMVRHKILDLIGDLSLIGFRLRAHIIAICSGHFSNVAFAKVLLETLLPRSF